MASIKFSSIFEVVAASNEEVLSLKAQADLIATIRDLAAKNGWSHIEVCAEGNRIMIKQVKSQVNDNRLSEAELIKGLDAHTAHADELFLNVDGELAEALIDQLNELELPFIVRSHKISQEANGK
jgi:predicted regulator of amino acid metabolism with ACT domain